MALEYENEILRNKIRSLVNQSHFSEANHQKENIKDDQEEAIYGQDIDELEFTVTEELLRFFEKSERHRREMKGRHNSDEEMDKEESAEDNVIIGGAASDRIRREEANALYGDASSKILAMEAALQATLDNYKDKVKPQFWPNIPFKP